MARTNSNMIPLGSEAKDFYLYDTVSESKVSFKKIKGSVGTIIFLKLTLLSLTVSYK